jgi:hypothetical protein
MGLTRLFLLVGLLLRVGRLLRRVLGRIDVAWIATRRRIAVV